MYHLSSDCRCSQAIARSQPVVISREDENQRLGRQGSWTRMAVSLAPGKATWRQGCSENHRGGAGASNMGLPGDSACLTGPSGRTASNRLAKAGLADASVVLAGLRVSN